MPDVSTFLSAVTKEWCSRTPEQKDGKQLRGPLPTAMEEGVEKKQLESGMSKEGCDGHQDQAGCVTNPVRKTDSGQG